VRLDYEYRLKEIMIEEFQRVVGENIKLKSDGPLIPELFATEKDPDYSLHTSDESYAVIKGSELWDEINSSTIMKDFENSFFLSNQDSNQ